MSPIPFGNVITAWLYANSINKKKNAHSMWNWHYCLWLPADCQVSHRIHYHDSSRLSRIDFHLFFFKLCCQPASHLHILIRIYFISSGFSTLRYGVPADTTITHTTQQTRTPWYVSLRYSPSFKRVSAWRQWVWHFFFLIKPLPQQA